MLIRDMAKGKQTDLYLSVDYADIPKFMIPEFADWYVIFAATGFVLRYTDQSKYAREVNAENWLEIIQREDVAFWRSDPENDPAGYRSLMVFQLAEKYYKIPGLGEKLAEKSGKQFLYPTLSRKGIKAIRFLTAHGRWAAKLSIYPTRLTFRTINSLNITGRRVSLFRSQTRYKRDNAGRTDQVGAHDSKNLFNRPAALDWTRLLLSAKGKSVMKHAGKHPLKPVFGW